MSEPVKISMPLYFETGKKKITRNYINLNGYRNWHFLVSNDLKKAYKLRAWIDIRNLKFKNKINLEFILWKADNRIGDRSNVLSIHEKFFCDALTECGCIPDDNDNYIEKTTYRTGGVDKMNPRVDIIITEVPYEGLFDEFR